MASMRRDAHLWMVVPELGDQGVQEELMRRDETDHAAAHGLGRAHRLLALGGLAQAPRSMAATMAAGVMSS
jgi:hypothetical protein